MNNQVLENYLTIPVDNEAYQEQVLRILVTEGPQIVAPILHVMLPGMKGWGVCQGRLKCEPVENWPPRYNEGYKTLSRLCRRANAGQQTPGQDV